VVVGVGVVVVVVVLVLVVVVMCECVFCQIAPFHCLRAVACFKTTVSALLQEVVQQPNNTHVRQLKEHKKFCQSCCSTRRGIRKDRGTRYI
jgi:hypothetical protein